MLDILRILAATSVCHEHVIGRVRVMTLDSGWQSGRDVRTKHLFPHGFKSRCHIESCKQFLAL